MTNFSILNCPIKQAKKLKKCVLLYIAKYFGVWSIIAVVGKGVLAITNLKISVKFLTVSGF